MSKCHCLCFMSQCDWAPATFPPHHCNSKWGKSKARLLCTFLFLHLRQCLDSHLRKRIDQLSISSVFSTTWNYFIDSCSKNWPRHLASLPWASGSKMKSENYFLNVLGKKRNKCSCNLSLLGLWGRNSCPITWTLLNVLRCYQDSKVSWG